MSEELHDTATRTEHPGFDLRAAAQVVGDLARVERRRSSASGRGASGATSRSSTRRSTRPNRRRPPSAQSSRRLSPRGGGGRPPHRRARRLARERQPRRQAHLAGRTSSTSASRSCKPNWRRGRWRGFACERRAACIGKHRKRFASDMAREVAAAERRYRRIVDELAQRERNRRTSQRRGSSTRRGCTTPIGSGWPPPPSVAAVVLRLSIERRSDRRPHPPRKPRPARAHARGRSSPLPFL